MWTFVVNTVLVVNETGPEVEAAGSALETAGSTLETAGSALETVGPVVVFVELDQWKPLVIEACRKDEEPPVERMMVGTGEGDSEVTSDVGRALAGADVEELMATDEADADVEELMAADDVDADAEELIVEEEIEVDEEDTGAPQPYLRASRTAEK